MEPFITAFATNQLGGLRFYQQESRISAKQFERQPTSNAILGAFTMCKTQVKAPCKAGNYR